MSMVWPDDRLQHRTRVAFGADVTADPGTWEWTDITDDVPAQSISITRGRQAAAGAVTPGQTGMVLDNNSGAYTPELATGAHYPHVVQGVPLQESLRGSATYLELPGAGARITTPSDAALEFTGDLDVRVDAMLTTWRVPGHHIALAAKGSSATTYSWEVGLNELGQPYVRWSETAAVYVLVAGVSLVIPPTGRLAVRWAVDMDDGDDHIVVTIYTAPTMAGPWTAQGDGIIVDVASQLYPTAAPVQAGEPTTPLYADNLPPVGRLHGLEVRDGIDGTVVASVTAAAVDEDAVTFVGDDGRTWTVVAPAVATRWVPRITASIAGWEPEWPHGDLSTDDDEGDARTTITAAGILQRMGQGASPLQSTLRRRIPSDPDVLAYWPCEDGVSSTQAGSGLPGGTPMRLTGVTWASDDTLPGSAALPATGDSATLSATVPAPTGTTPDGWHVECVYRADSETASAAEVLTVRLAGSLFSSIRMKLDGSDFLVTFVYADGTTADDTSTLPAPNSIDTWNRLVLYSRQLTSTTMSFHFAILTIGGTQYNVDSATLTGKIGRVSGLSATYGSAIQGLRIGHVGVFATQETSIYNAADTGFAEENAAERLVRLCAEENIPLLVCGDTSVTAPMGPQGMKAVTALLQEAADTDGGILGEQRDRLGLRYRTRSSLYNQTPALSLDAGLNQIANPFRPKLSDQGLTNRVTAQRSGGSSATIDDPDSIARSGLYESQVTVNPQTDDQLPNIAAWQVHLGTAPGMRYPQITSDLTVAPDLAGDWLASDLGDLLEVTNLPPQHPTNAVQAIAQGVTETYSPTSWVVAANCTPGGVWNVGVLGSTTRKPRAGTSGCVLAEDATATATSLSVTTTTGARWADSATYPDDFPFGWDVAGERVTVTAITGTGTDQVATVTRSVNGVSKAQTAGATVRLADRTYTAL